MPSPVRAPDWRRSVWPASPARPGGKLRSSLVELLQCSLRAVRSQFCIAERQQLRSGIGQKCACAFPGTDLFHQAALTMVYRGQGRPSRPIGLQRRGAYKFLLSLAQGSCLDEQMDGQTKGLVIAIRRSLIASEAFRLAGRREAISLVCKRASRASSLPTKKTFFRSMSCATSCPSCVGASTRPAPSCNRWQTRRPTAPPICVSLKR